MTITIPVWFLYALTIIVGIPLLIVIGFCIWFTWSFLKYTKEDGWYI